MNEGDYPLCSLSPSLFLLFVLSDFLRGMPVGYSESSASNLWRRNLRRFSIVILLAVKVSCARRLEPSEVLSSPLSFVPLIPVANARVAGFVPKFNTGGPCLPPEVQKAAIVYSGQGLGTNSSIAANSLTLNGAKCGSAGGGLHWQIRKAAASMEELRDADRAFRFFASISADPSRSRLKWMYATGADGAAIVQCGQGRGVSRLLLLRPPTRGSPLVKRQPQRQPQRESEQLPGHLILILDARDKSGKAYTCNFVEKGSSLAGNNTKTADTRNTTKSSGAPSSSGTEDDRESSSSGNLSSSEIGGIVAGVIGVLLALAVVTIAATLWRHQRTRRRVVRPKN